METPTIHIHDQGRDHRSGDRTGRLHLRAVPGGPRRAPAPVAAVPPPGRRGALRPAPPGLGRRPRLRHRPPHPPGGARPTRRAPRDGPRHRRHRPPRRCLGTGRWRSSCWRACRTATSASWPKLHHGAADGVAAAELLANVMDLEPDPPNPPVDRAVEPTGGARPCPPWRRLLWAAITEAFRGLGRILSLLRRTLRSLLAVGRRRRHADVSPPVPVLDTPNVVLHSLTPRRSFATTTLARRHPRGQGRRGRHGQRRAARPRGRCAAPTSSAADELPAILLVAGVPVSTDQPDEVRRLGGNRSRTCSPPCPPIRRPVGSPGGAVHDVTVALAGGAQPARRRHASPPGSSTPRRGPYACLARSTPGCASPTATRPPIQRGGLERAGPPGAAVHRRRPARVHLLRGAGAREHRAQRHRLELPRPGACPARSPAAISVPDLAGDPGGMRDSLDELRRALDLVPA